MAKHVMTSGKKTGRSGPPTRRELEARVAREDAERALEDNAQAELQRFDGAANAALDALHKNIFPGGKISLDTFEDTSYTRPQLPEYPGPEQETKTMILTLQAKQPSKSNAFVYTIPGLRGTVRFAKKLFASETAPEQVAVQDEGFATLGAAKTAKVKETKEERAARLAAMTPEQKRQADLDRIAAQEARLAKRKAALVGAQ